MPGIFIGRSLVGLSLFALVDFHQSVYTHSVRFPRGFPRVREVSIVRHFRQKNCIGTDSVRADNLLRYSTIAPLNVLFRESSVHCLVSMQLVRFAMRLRHDSGGTDSVRSGRTFSHVMGICDYLWKFPISHICFAMILDSTQAIKRL